MEETGAIQQLDNLIITLTDHHILALEQLKTSSLCLL